MMHSREQHRQQLDPSEIEAQPIKNEGLLIHLFPMTVRELETTLRIDITSWINGGSTHYVRDAIMATWARANKRLVTFVVVRIP